MVTGQREQANREAPPPVAKVEDNTLDEQHAGIGKREFPVTDNDQSRDDGQAHVPPSPTQERERRR